MPGYGMQNKGAFVGPGSISPVVIVSGMNEEKVTPDAIFTLFGVYGDVIKVKILFTKKDTALVQMATPQQAEAVITHLNSCPLFGQPIRVNFSKHSTIMIPSNNPSEENTKFTKEYVGSPLHRFKSANKTFKHVCAPSATLHVSSIPPSGTEESMKSFVCGTWRSHQLQVFLEREKDGARSNGEHCRCSHRPHRPSQLPHRGRAGPHPHLVCQIGHLYLS